MPKPDPSQKPEGMDWDLWIGPAKNNGYTPGLHAFSWRGYWDYGTGSLGDMGCHIMDVPIKALGIFEPYSIEASVPRVRPVSCMTIPGYWYSNIADMPPKKRPSSAA